MNARNDVKTPSDQSLNARLVLAAAQLRFAARVDFLVARWLERCATNAEAGQRLFKTPYPNSRVPKPFIAFALLALLSLVLAGCDSGQDEGKRPSRNAPVLTIEVRYEPQTPDRRFFGTIRPRIESDVGLLDEPVAAGHRGEAFRHEPRADADHLGVRAVAPLAAFRAAEIMCARA
jgi:hypothetical protein